MKSPKKLAPIFAEIEPYIYLCNVKEMIIVELSWFSLRVKLRVKPKKEIEEYKEI